MIYALDGNAWHIKEKKFEWKWNKCSILHENRKSKGFAETYLYQKYSVLASIFLVVWTCVFPLQHHSPSFLDVICLCLLDFFLDTVYLHHLNSFSWQSSVYSVLHDSSMSKLNIHSVDSMTHFAPNQARITTYQHYVHPSITVT